MKIEKINDNQIRCTLTREDLANREINLSELAYGSEKAKSLFRDMMQQASHDFGFEANNIPLMIEAIPLSSDSIILIITKVEDPEELDTRFSRFSPEEEGSGSADAGASAPVLSGADEILDLIRKINQARKMAAEQAKADEASKAEAPVEEIVEEEEETSDEAFHFTRFYLFRNLETVIRACRVVADRYTGPNALFKNSEDQSYYLILKKADTDAEQFNRVCNILSEYALPVSYTAGMEEYFTEHMDVIVARDAIQHLSQL